MDFSTPQVIRNGNSYTVQHGTDAGLFVQFYMEALHDEEASAQEGRPIYVDREFIKIIPVGDKNTVVCRPVKLNYDGNTPPDNERWPNQYQAFKNQQIQTNEGTPLDQWPPISKSQVLMFKACNVHTVEQLAAVADNNLANLGMGARELQQRAVAFLSNAKDGAGTTQLIKENEELRMQIEGLRNQMNDLISRVGSDDEDKPRRGRPPKTQE